MMRMRWKGRREYRSKSKTDQDQRIWFSWLASFGLLRFMIIVEGKIVYFVVFICFSFVVVLFEIDFLFLSSQSMSVSCVCQTLFEFVYVFVALRYCQ